MTFDRDASNRLYLTLEIEGSEALSKLKAMGATFGEREEDPLGESAWIPFELLGAQFEIESEWFRGLTITSLTSEGDSVLREVCGQFE